MWNQEVFDEAESPEEANLYETEVNGLLFQALIAPVQLSSNARALILGDGNVLYKPSKSIYVYATRGYFTYTKMSGISMARSIVMDFGGDEQTTTYIDTIEVDDEGKGGTW